jgi:hypothetical protein
MEIQVASVSKFYSLSIQFTTRRLKSEILTMKNRFTSSMLPAFLALAVTTAFTATARSQALDFTLEGSFSNPVKVSAKSVSRIDNDLTNGFNPAIDTFLAPSIVNPEGAAAFEWGKRASFAPFPHTSGLLFDPSLAVSAIPDQEFVFGSLWYRNGTILDATGAQAVDLTLDFDFAPELGIGSQSVTYGLTLVNTLNTSDPIASADIVRLNNGLAPLNFNDAAGNQYFLEVGFRVDPATLNNTLSTPSEFRVLEGGTGRADLVGRFSVAPIPEPGSAVLVGLAALGCLRRRRRHA